MPDKTGFRRDIVGQMHQEGRLFLRKNKTTGLYSYLNDVKSRLKLIQALREVKIKNKRLKFLFVKLRHSL